VSLNYEELMATWDRMTKQLDEQRRVIICPRVQVSVVQALIDSHGTGGLFRVLGNDIIGDRVVLVDPNMHTEYLELWEEDRG
jgi:hypothetical protein